MKKKKSSVVIIWALTGISLVGTGGLGFWQSTKLAEVGTRVKELKLKIEEEGDVEKKLEEINIKVIESKAKLVHLEQGVPMRAYVPTMMTELEEIGKKNGIEVTGVRPMAPKFPPPPAGKDKDGNPLPAASKPYDEQNIEVKGTGSYLSVLSFVSALERFPKIVQVTTVTMLPKNDPSNSLDKPLGGSPTLEVTVELKAFLFTEDHGNEFKDDNGTKPVATLGGKKNGSF